ncbi:MAG: hypothetical protein F6J95_026140 [Leptolyngbya sp. SIO1E4]|nr:hypothetical protein [Leptolyngbya sp. SIO1E4]
MDIRPIRAPLPDEHLVGIQPTLMPQVTAPWRRRLNLFTGRSLSATALETEQQTRAGRLATYGQRVSPGVVQGLEVVLDDASTAEAATVLVTAGQGITALGEDVILSLNRQVRLLDVPVVAPALDEAEEAPPIPPEEPAQRRHTIQGRLADLIRTGDASRLPPVAVLMLQPVIAEVRNEFEATDPCEADPQNDAFEDWQRVDGARLLLYSYPTEWQADLTPLLPDNPTAVQIHRWRSRVAHTLFEREAALRRGETLPWAEWGVPIALLGFGPQPDISETEEDASATWYPLFADGYAVVRQGGQTKRRSQPRSLTVLQHPFVWQARVQQFAEQLTEMAPMETPEDGRDRRQGFDRLPPVGVLPNAALDLTANRLPFFPISYDIRLRPIPQEQLDAVMVASAGLAPLRLNRAEQVQVLLPVPEALYDPNLLDFNTNVDSTFLEQIQEFVQRRGELLQRQQDLRQKLQALYRGIKGEALDFSEADADVIDPDETPTTGTLDPPEDAYGTAVQQGQRVAQSLEDLKNRLRDTPLQREVNRYLERNSPNFAGLETFIQILENKVKRANDPIDFGFLRVRSDLYRIRQFMLGAEEASRLVTSPVLADIVKKEESAFLTQQNLSAIFDALRQDAREPGGEPQIASTDLPPTTSETPAFTAATFQVPFTTTVFSQELISAAPRSASPTPVQFPLLQAEASFDDSIFVESQSRRADSLQVTGDTGKVLTPFAGTLKVADAIAPTTRLFQQPQRVIPQEAVVEQLPLLGAVTRSATVGERLKPGEALDSLNFAVEGQLQTVQLLALRDEPDGDSILNVDDLEIPGTRTSSDAAGLPFSRLTDAIASLQQQKLEDTGQARDEARLYERGIKSLEDTVATLRLVEGRVQAYRLAIADCRGVLKQLQGFLNQADVRLKSLGDELAEARHDVAVAQALREEEEARLQTLVDERRQILQNYVPFLVFHRPRAVSPRVSMPHHGINPAPAEPAVPVCLRSHPPLPTELRQAVNLLQDAPVKWFTRVAPLLNRFDQLPLLRNTLTLAQTRAARTTSQTTVLPGLTTSASRLSQAISRTVLAQTQVAQRYRQQTAQLNISSLVNLSWSRARDRARDLLSLGDLLNSQHQRSDITRQVNREVDLIAQVSGCLYASFSDVLPQIRLQWAESLSQYDTPVDLHQLASLPRWDQIPYRERRQMQELVDWLYSRINRKEADAVALMHDLVRICILLASQAPVSQIIAGRVSKPTTLRPGSRVELTIDASKIRIGMPVLLYGTNNQVVAEARVEDLSADQAAVQVTRTQRSQSIQIDADARAQFGTSLFGGFDSRFD